MMENKLVSIVIATFNAEKYILDLLDSVKKQTYENLELIIADDCSADNTQNIICLLYTSLSNATEYGRRMRYY